MSPIQQMLLGAGGAAATKTYVDDVFSTFLFTGTGSPKTITNGIDFAGEGGMVWVKSREQTLYHSLMDTERGGLKAVFSNANSAEDVSGSGSSYVSSFNNNGVSLGTWGNVGGSSGASGKEYATWSFRKAPGFFDVVTYTGNSSTNQTISHNLGCIPGSIWVKCTSNNLDWSVYHRSLDGGYQPETHILSLNTTDGESDSATDFADTAPTATQFTVGSNLNDNGWTYVVYLFAGGESTAATARSVSFPGTGTVNLSIADSSDFDLGTTFTIEAWVKPDYSANNGYYVFFRHGNLMLSVRDTSGGFFDAEGLGGQLNSGDNSVPEGQWTHVAVVANSGTVKLYVNGVHNQNTTRTGQDYSGTATAYIGSRNDGFYPYKGEISNLRIVKGTAVYTSSFRPPTEPLTNITNTKLLCCNDSSVTGSTVTPNTITANGSPTASTDSPFDDPAGFVFGDAGDQGIIKCGSYVGTGSTDLPVALGWAPQWIMVKRFKGSGALGSRSGDWVMVDQYRQDNETFRERLYANGTDAPGSTDRSTIPITHEPGYIPNTALGFNVVGTDSDVNDDGSTYIYVAIRRDAGLVKRPPSVGTDVFALASTTGDAKPSFVSGFPVDFALHTVPTSNGWNNRFYAKAGGPTAIYANMSNGGNSDNRLRAMDVMNGFGKDFSTANSNFFAWMWRSYTGAVAMAYDATGEVMAIPHELGKTPEMVFIKGVEFGTGATQNWAVYHKALASDKILSLNTNYTATDANAFNQTAPTSTHVTVGTSTKTNAAQSSGNPPTIYRMMVFASVSGISKIDSFDGSNSDLTVTVGFQPRFLMVKAHSSSGNWVIVDTSRGWGSGNDKIRHLNSTSVISDADVGAPTSTGFTLTGNNADWNQSGTSYIYYAHA